MKRSPFLQILVFIVLTSCTPKPAEHILVDSGKPSALLLPGEEWIEKEDYMESREGYYMRATQALAGGDFHISATLELGGDNSTLWIMVADNRLGINRSSGIMLEGPSFNRSFKWEKDLKEIIPVEAPFELEIFYENNQLECVIDGERLLTEPVINEPFGRVGFDGSAKKGYLRIYHWTLRGEMGNLEECYSRERLLARAQKSMDLRAEEVKDDPNRPLYHLQPPANWNNDPNGTLYYKGYYHMFYQHNPFDDQWGWMHWGHMRSRDLVHWEHLPIALWPSIENGEEHCFSGSAIVNKAGEPMLFYTSIGHPAPEQWVAIPRDDDLIEWEKHPGNPILSIDDHKGETIVDWRDPQLIHEGEETFMVVGGHPEDKGGSIMLYKALNEELTQWDYLGTAFSGDERNWECPNFFRIGEQWVLLYSPHGAVRYFTGNFNMESYQFMPEKEGNADHGSNFYAPNTMEDGKGRRLLWGWIPGFKQEQGWQSAITLPRNLTVSPEGWLIQEPVEELIQLRGAHQSVGEMTLKDEVRELEVPGHEFEMMATFSNHSAKSYGIRFNTEKAGEVFEITVGDDRIMFGEKEISLEPLPMGDDLSFRLFLTGASLSFM